MKERKIKCNRGGRRDWENDQGRERLTMSGSKLGKHEDREGERDCKIEIKRDKSVRSRIVDEERVRRKTKLEIQAEQEKARKQERMRVSEIESM